MITSRSNEAIKFFKSLSERKFRKENGLFIVEGERFVKDAIGYGLKPKHVIYTQKYEQEFSDSENGFFVSDEVFESISDVKTPQGIAAVFAYPACDERALFSSNRIIYLENVQNSDNVGAIIRSAACCGYEAAVLNEACADCYSGKAVRASAANIFKLGIFFDDDGMLLKLKKNGYKIYGAHLSGEESVKFDNKKTVLIVGNEGNGMSNEATALCDELIKIPIAKNCESLNVACAATVLMYKSIGY